MMDVMKPLRVFLEIGEDGAHFEQAAHMMGNTSRLLCFTFIASNRGRYTVPALCGYGDVAIWASNEAVFTFGDIAQLWKQAKAQDLCAVYVPKAEKDSPAPSVMLFRNKYCERLTPGYVYSATPEQLAPAVWAGGPQNVGTLEV